MARRRQTRTVETSDYAKFARRILRAYGRRIEDMDIEGLAGLVELREELDATIAQAVAKLTDKDAPPASRYSWADIGRVLRCTRQAAQQRFGKKKP